VDGRLWPIANDTTVWLPPGKHAVQTAEKTTPLRILEFTGDLKSAKATSAGVELAYESTARALALFDRLPSRIEIDGIEVHPEVLDKVVLLPRGQHLVSFGDR